jgi:hypothetical protein
MTNDTDPRRRRSHGKGVTLVSVTRRRQPTLAPRPRQAPDGHKQGGTQPTNTSMSNRRGYWLRRSRGSVAYNQVTHSRGGPGPPDPQYAGLDIHSHTSHTRRPPSAAEASIASLGLLDDVVGRAFTP